MYSKTSSVTMVVIFIASILASQNVDAASRARCTDDELDEAQKSFRNCVDSAKAGIVTRHGGQTSENAEYEDTKVEEKVDVAPLCDELVRSYIVVLFNTPRARGSKLILQVYQNLDQNTLVGPLIKI